MNAKCRSGMLFPFILSHFRHSSVIEGCWGESLLKLASPSPAAIWNFYQECGNLENSPKLGRLGKQNLQIPLKLFKRTLDGKDHTFMHVNCMLTYRAEEEQSWLRTAEADTINLNPLPETSKSYCKIHCTCHHSEGLTLFWLGFCILG